ncbi:alpha/beta hydrolase [Coralloluteibacterium stylophorae]|nr:alpha/beta fold hydrolase [Coralloluteibacterium stylophorae]
MLVLLSALAAPAGAAATASSFAACADDDQPGLAGSRCLRDAMPLRHGTQGDEAITIALRRFPAHDDGAHRGEVWLVAGGPGEAGASLYPMVATYRRAFPGYDLVIPDHRGTGASTRLCPAQEAVDSADGVALAGEEWGPCIGAMYAEPARAAAFNVTEAAQDLSTLIARHRGEGEVLVYGVSYGTQLVLRMLQVAPQPLDGVILDGLVPPERASHWDLSHRTAVVDEVGRDLLGAAGVDAYERLLATADPELWREAAPGGDLPRLMGTLLNFPALRARIPQVIDALAADDVAPLQEVVADLRTTTAAMTPYPLSPPSLPLVMLISASENNARPQLTKETVEAEAGDALFTSAIPGLLVDAPVPAYQRDAWYGRSPDALPRTLVIHGTLDPNTPYAGARAHAALLAKAGPVTFATVEDGAHLLAYVAPACFVGTVSAFVRNASVSERCSEAVAAGDVATAEDPA